jgi:hypothetical protein
LGSYLFAAFFLVFFFVAIFFPGCVSIIS